MKKLTFNSESGSTGGLPHTINGHTCIQASIFWPNFINDQSMILVFIYEFPPVTFSKRTAILSQTKKSLSNFEHDTLRLLSLHYNYFCELDNKI